MRSWSTCEAGGGASRRRRSAARPSPRGQRGRREPRGGRLLRPVPDWSAPQSPLNREIGPYRRFDWVLRDLAELKRIKTIAGGTVNDVILSAVTGALGRYLRSTGASTRGLELRAMVPISVRADEEHGALGNKVSAMMAPLPVWCDDPIERLRNRHVTHGGPEVLPDRRSAQAS